ADEDMIGRTPEDLVAATLSHRELGQHRPPGEARLRATCGPEGDDSVLEIVTDDMPFLVESVAGALAARDLEVHLLVHPVMVVRRDTLGTLRQTRPDMEPDDAEPGDVVESWIRVEINRVADELRLRTVRDGVAQVLADVRSVVDDWSMMRNQALALADELTSTRLPVPDKDITDSIELLYWLADDNFTFLGYREYRLGTGDEDKLVLDHVPGPGLGILRADHTAPH